MNEVSTNIPGAGAGQGGQTTTSASATAGGTTVSAVGTVPQSVSAAPQDWTSGLNDDLKGYVQNKGFKAPGDVLDSYRNFEKLMGAPKDRLLKLPEKADDVEGWKGIYDKLGRPSTPDEYKMEVPAGQPPEFSKWAQGLFHEAGLSKAQGEKIGAKWNEYQSQAAAARLAQTNDQSTQQEEGLRKEWGMAFDQNISVAKRAAQVFGFGADTIDKLERSMGYDGVMKFFNSIGTKVGEDKFVGSGQGTVSGALTPEAAQNQINALRQDNAFVKRYVAGDVSARAEMDRLHRFAYPS